MPRPFARHHLLGLALILLGLLINQWTLATWDSLALALEDPFFFAGLHGAQAAAILLGLGLWLGSRLPGSPTLRFFLILGVVVLGSIGTRQWVFAKKAPEVILRMKSWRLGSPMFAYSPALVDWASETTFAWEQKGMALGRLAALHGSVAEYLLRVDRVALARRHAEHGLDLEEKRGADSPGLRDALRRLAMVHLRRGELDYCFAGNGEEACLFPLRDGGLWGDPVDANVATDLLLRLLEFAPEDPGARWLLNLSRMVADDWPHGVPEEHRLPAIEIEGDLVASAGFPSFRNIAGVLGVDTTNISGGAVMDDFDGDGLLDLVATSCGRDEPMDFFRNGGDGQFVSRRQGSGLADQFGGLNLAHADYDNDGDLDLFVPRGAWMVRHGKIRNSLLRNDGLGTFTDVTEEAGLADPAWPCLAVAWGDYDLDGDLDLYIGNERLDFKTCAPSQLFRNEGDGTFSDVAVAAGVTNDEHVRAVSWGDYDNDGDPDLLVVNFLAPNRFYLNDGDGSFTDIAPQLGIARLGGFERHFASWFFDYDNDGWLDVFIGSYPMTATFGTTVPTSFGQGSDLEQCHLFRNDRKGGFEDVSVAAGLNVTLLCMGANYGDFDGDGWTDIYLGTGAPPYEALVPNLLLRNVAGRRFANVTPAAGLGHLQKGHGVAPGDLDNDGDLDLWSQLGGWYLSDRFPNALFLNEGTENHWLGLRLRGNISNHFGVGARVRVRVAENGRIRDIHQMGGTGASFGGGSHRLEFGLGQADRILEIQVRWPASEEIQQIEAPPLNSWLQITEGRDGFSLWDAPTVSLGR